MARLLGSRGQGDAATQGALTRFVVPTAHGSRLRPEDAFPALGLVKTGLGYSPTLERLHRQQARFGLLVGRVRLVLF